MLGAPDASLVAVAADDPALDPFVVADEMRLRGWYLQPQPAFAGSPANLHLTVTAAVADPDRIAELLAELGRRGRPGPRRRAGRASTRARSSWPRRLDPDALGPDEVALALEVAGVGPGRRAAGADGARSWPSSRRCRPRLTERLLPEVVSRLYTPSPRADPGPGGTGEPPLAARRRPERPSGAARAAGRFCTCRTRPGG